MTKAELALPREIRDVIQRLKLRARVIKRKTPMAHIKALNLVAVEVGFEDWGALMHQAAANCGLPKMNVRLTSKSMPISSQLVEEFASC